MSEAKSSYKPIHGGNLMRKTKNTVKTIARKTKNSANAANKFIDRNAHYVSYLDEDLGRNLQDFNTGLKGVGEASNRLEGAVGGKFNMQNAIRKAENTGKRAKTIARKTKNTASRVLDYAAPIAMELGQPALSAAFMGANAALGGKLGKKKNPYLIGGSFKTQGGSFKTQGAGMCPTCGHHKVLGGKIQLGRSESSILSSTHNSFAPLPPKPFLGR